MKLVQILVLGILFGITLSKAEIISWYRIYEMFHFQSFHMYGVIGSAVLFGIIAIQIIKKKQLKTFSGETPEFKNKEKSILRYLIGGVFFGLGWALVGACPGPMFILLGHGYESLLVVIISAILGTFLYGLFKNKLPH
ncbi:MAG: DUF6691 family protein [Flavobacteriales bacterium]